MIKIGKSNERSSPETSPSAVKGGYIKRSNKAFRSSFIFDGEHMTPREDVVTSGIGEGEEADSPSRQFRPVKRDNFSPDSKVSNLASVGSPKKEEEIQPSGNVDGDGGAGSSQEATTKASPEQVLTSGIEETKIDKNSETADDSFRGRQSPLGGHAFFEANPLPGQGQGLRSSLLDSLHHDRRIAMKMMGGEGLIPETVHDHQPPRAQWAPQPEMVHGHFGAGAYLHPYESTQARYPQPYPHATVPQHLHHPVASSMQARSQTGHPHHPQPLPGHEGADLLPSERGRRQDSHRPILGKEQYARQAPEKHYTVSYHGEAPKIYPGQPPVEKEGYMWVAHKGVRQRCLVEAALTVFKGECMICLLDAVGQPFRGSPVKIFQLCGVGNLIVTVAENTLCLQDGPQACLLECEDSVEAQDWAEFLCSSVLSNPPVIRNRSHVEAVGAAITEAVALYGPGAGAGSAARPPGQAPSSRSPRKRPQDQPQQDPNEDRPIGGSIYRAEHPETMDEGGVGDGAEGAGPHTAPLPLHTALSQLSLSNEDTFGEEDSPETIQEKIDELEGRLDKNHRMFEERMEDKENELVRECKLHYKMDKAQVKADLAGLKAHLSKRPEEEISAEQREEEELKIQIWLKHKLDELTRENDARLTETEAAFHKHKESEADRLAKVNKKISVKIQILMERLRRVKRRVQAEGPRSKMHAEHSNMLVSEVEAEDALHQKGDKGKLSGSSSPLSGGSTPHSLAFTVGDDDDQHHGGVPPVSRFNRTHPAPSSRRPAQGHPNRKNATHHAGGLTFVAGSGAKEEDSHEVHGGARDAANRRGGVHIRGAGSGGGGAGGDGGTAPEFETHREKMKRHRAEAEGARLARLNRAANQNREHNAVSPPIPTLRPGGSMYKERLTSVSGEPLAANINRNLGYGRRRNFANGQVDPQFVMSLGVGRDPSRTPKLRKYALLAKTITSLTVRPHLVLQKKAEMIQKAWDAHRVKRRTNFFLKPLYDLRREEHYAAMIIQKLWRRRQAKYQLGEVVQMEIRRILLRSIFTFIRFAYVWIARVRIKMRKHEVVVAKVLKKVLQRRKKLIAVRAKQRVEAQIAYKVKAPDMDHSSAERGLTKRLTRRAQLQSEQKMRLGILHPVVDGLRNGRKALTKMLTRALQIESDDQPQYGEDYDDELREKVERNREGTDFTHGLQHKFDTHSTDVNDIRAAHLRGLAVSSFVKIKSHERNKFEERMPVHHYEMDSDDED